MIFRVPESERILTGSAAEASNGNSSAPFCRCNHVLLKGVQCTCGGGELVETCDINTGQCNTISYRMDRAVLTCSLSVLFIYSFI